MRYSLTDCMRGRSKDYTQCSRLWLSACMAQRSSVRHFNFCVSSRSKVSSIGLRGRAETTKAYRDSVTASDGASWRLSDTSRPHCGRSNLLPWCRAIVDDVGDHAIQSALSSDALTSCVGLTLSFHDAHKLSRYFSLWRPSLYSPLYFQSPPNSQGHQACLLKTCPRKAGCRLRIPFTSVYAVVYSLNL